MYPILFHIGDFRLSTYGLMVALSFVVAFTYVVKMAEHEGEDSEVYLDLCYYILISSIIGARIFYIAINWDYYAKDPLAMIKIWQGGLVFYGGLIAAILTCVWYIRKHKLDFWKMGDIFMPSVPLAHVFGRMGCLFAGCCYGEYAPNLPWAIHFHNPASLAPKNIPLHPTQIYSSLSSLTVFLILMVIWRYRKFKGQVFASYLILYPIFRSTVELYRGDIGRKFLPLPGAPQLISTGQFVSILLFLFGVFLYYRLYKRHKLSLG